MKQKHAAKPKNEIYVTVVPHSRRSLNLLTERTKTTWNSILLPQKILSRANSATREISIPDEQLEEIISALVAIDDEYLRKIAEDDSPYDEEYVYEHMLKSVSSKFSRYQTYLMRLVDDYMDFMEQYLVSIDAVEWE